MNGKLLLQSNALSNNSCKASRDKLAKANKLMVMLIEEVEAIKAQTKKLWSNLCFLLIIAVVKLS